MKTTKILYWVFTVLILGLMLFSAMSTFMMPAGGEKIAAQIQFPLYIFTFLAVAKILGIIAILVPGYPRLKEWAYAGFFFDMAGATYAFIATGSPVSEWAPMIIFFIFLFGSYICYHQKLKAQGA
jgi:hypothetical protein